MSQNGDMARRSFRQEHGPKDFYYTLLPDMKPHPVVRCLCGWMAELIFDSWEEAGKALDMHLTASLRKEDLMYHATLKEGAGAAKAAAR